MKGTVIVYSTKIRGGIWGGIRVYPGSLPDSAFWFLAVDFGVTY
jgi:hypothetical protein